MKSIFTLERFKSWLTAFVQRQAAVCAYHCDGTCTSKQLWWAVQVPGNWLYGVPVCFDVSKIGPIGDFERISFIYILITLTGVLWAVKVSNSHRLDRPTSCLFINLMSSEKCC